MPTFEVKLVRVTRALSTRTVVAASEEEARKKVETALEEGFEPEEEDTEFFEWEVFDAEEGEELTRFSEVAGFCKAHPDATAIQVMAYADGKFDHVYEVAEWVVSEHGGPEGVGDSIVEWMQDEEHGGQPLRLTAFRATGRKCGPDETFDTVGTADVL